MYTQDYLFQISRYLGYFETHLYYENSTGKFDLNKEAEKFLIPVLNILFGAGTDFKRLEIEKENHPGIDLGEINKKIAFQVTSQKGYSKIKKTLLKIIEYRLFEKYEHFYHLIVDRDYNTEKTQKDIEEYIASVLEKEELDAATAISFDIKKNLWNLTRLREEIETKCTPEQLQEIVTHLKANYGPITELADFRDMLIPYRITYEKELDKDTKIENYQFHNPFVGREDKLDKLKEFGESTDQKLMIVTGAGGTGKTRACLEYFEKFVDDNEAKIAFTLHDINYDAAAFRRAVDTGQQIFILLDDGEKAKRILNSLVSQIKSIGNVKLIITTRESSYNDVLNSLPSHLKDHVKLPMGNLEYDETKALFTSLLQGADPKSIIAWAGKSSGVPLVILAMADLILKGKNIEDLSELEAFNSHIDLVINQAALRCEQETHIGLANIHKVISALSFLGPVKNEDDEINVLSNIAGIPAADTAIVLESLQKDGILGRQNHQYVIKPDAYSDQVLFLNSTRVKYWLRIPETAMFRERIIKNMVRVSDRHPANFDLNKVLDEFIEYLAQLAASKKYSELVAGLETIESFTYRKPDLAIYALEIVLGNLTEDNSEDDLGFLFSYKRIRDVHKKMCDVLSIAILNSHGQSRFDKGFKLALSLFSKAHDATMLTSPFRYRVFDFDTFGYYPEIMCERQLYVVDHLTKIASSETISDTDQEIILLLSSQLLTTQFSIEEFYEYQTGQFSYGIAEVPQKEPILKIRGDVHKLLTENFEKFNFQNQEKILSTLIRKVQHLGSNLSRRDRRFDESLELKEYLSFLSGQIATGKFPTQNGDLIRSVQRVEEFGIKPEFQKEIDVLNSLLFNAQTDSDRLKTFLNFEHRALESTLKKEVEYMISTAGSAEKLLEIFENIRKDCNIFEKQNMQLILFEIIGNHPEIAEKILEIVISQPFEGAEFYAIFSRLIYKDERKFYQTLDYFWKLGTPNSKTAVIGMLSSGRLRDQAYYREDDLKYFEIIVDEKNMQAIQSVSYELDKFLHLNLQRGLTIVERILGPEINYNDHGYLLRSIFDKKVTDNLDPVILKDFLMTKTSYLKLDHDFDNALRFLENNFGFDEVLNFLEEKSKEAQGTPYQHISYLGYHYPLEDGNDDNSDRFIQIIERYIDKDLDTYVELIKLFRPIRGFDEMLKEKLEKLTASFNGDKKKILKMMDILKLFENVNQQYLEFSLDMANILEEQMGANKEEIEGIFHTGFLFNTGSKSKPVAALAFPEDLHRKNIINKCLETKPIQTKTKVILLEILSRVEQSISDTEKETLERFRENG